MFCVVPPKPPASHACELPRGSTASFFHSFSHSFFHSYVPPSLGEPWKPVWEGLGSEHHAPFAYGVAIPWWVPGEYREN